MPQPTTIPRTLADLNVGMIQRIRDALAEEVVVEHPPGISMGQLFDDNPRLIHCIQHGRLFSWLLVASVLTTEAIRAGGGRRTPLGVAHRVFDRIPLALPMLNRFIPNAGILGFEELVESFGRGPFTDLAVSPEGDNCNFGNGVDVEPFRSPRFVELALRCDAPLLLIVHNGTASWGHELKLSEGNSALRLLPYGVGERAIERGHVVLPLVRRTPRFELKYALYHPTLRADELSEDPDERREQLWVEAHAVRQTMQRMVDSMKRSSGDRQS